MDRVEKLAKTKPCNMSNLALAWLLHKDTCPIARLNSIQRTEKASGPLSVSLTAWELDLLKELYQPPEVQEM